MQRVQSLALILCCLTAATSSSIAQVSVWTSHNDNARTGLNPSETILTTIND